MRPVLREIFVGDKTSYDNNYSQYYDDGGNHGLRFLFERDLRGEDITSDLNVAARNIAPNITHIAIISVEFGVVHVRRCVGLEVGINYGLLSCGKLS